MSARMTPTQIRKATPFPKPRDAIALALRYKWGGGWRERPTTAGLKLLRHIAEYADLIDHPVVMDQHGPMRGQWLLVPLPQYLLDALARLDAETADLEPDEGDFEDNGDGEPSLGSSANVSQVGWGTTSSHHLDLEEEHDGREEEEDLGPEEDEVRYPIHLPIGRAP